MTRNMLRVIIFDVLTPVLAVSSVVMIGVILGWPIWWVVACTASCLLIAEGVAVNAYLAQRDSVTVGTDDDGPGLRAGIVAVATIATVAMATLGYLHWTLADQRANVERSAAVEAAAELATTVLSFDPDQPDSFLHQATERMSKEQARVFTSGFARATAQLRAKRITQRGEVISAGLEAIGPNAAVVTTLMRRTSIEAGMANSQTVMALRLSMTKADGGWLVDDIAGIDKAAPDSPNVN